MKAKAPDLSVSARAPTRALRHAARLYRDADVGTMAWYLGLPATIDAVVDDYRSGRDGAELRAADLIGFLGRFDTAEAVSVARRLERNHYAESRSASFLVRAGLFRELMKLGDTAGAAAVAERLPPDRATGMSTSIKKAQQYEAIRLAVDLDALLVGEEPRGDGNTTKGGRDNRILYVAHHALPYHENGYAHRTIAICRTMREKGWDVTLAGRPGFPYDRALSGGAPSDVPSAEVRDGVPHRWLPSMRHNLRHMPPLEYFRTASRSLERLIREEGISLVHAASNHECALPAAIAAHRCGIPWIYEARGCWEVTRASRERHFQGSALYMAQQRLERWCATRADVFFALNDGIGEFYGRDPITGATHPYQVLPNGAYGDLSEAGDPEDFRRNYKIGAGDYVVGYVGSLVDYEGLDVLIQALAGLGEEERSGWTALIVGDGPARAYLEGLAGHYKVSDRIVFAGQLTRNALTGAYSAMDVVCLPRRSWRVCELVTPLKPFEAMIAGRPLVMADVRPLRDLAEASGGGITFQSGSWFDLLRTLRELQVNPAKRGDIGRVGRKFAMQHSDWRHATSPLDAVYTELCSTSATSDSIGKDDSAPAREASPPENAAESAISRQLSETQVLLEKYYARCQDLERQLHERDERGYTP